MGPYPASLHLPIDTLSSRVLAAKLFVEQGISITHGQSLERLLPPGSFLFLGYSYNSHLKAMLSGVLCGRWRDGEEGKPLHPLSRVRCRLLDLPKIEFCYQVYPLPSYIAGIPSIVLLVLPRISD